MEHMHMGAHALTWSTSDVYFFLFGTMIQSRFWFLVSCIFLFLLGGICQCLEIPQIRKKLTNQYEINENDEKKNIEAYRTKLQKIKQIKVPSKNKNRKYQNSDLSRQVQYQDTDRATIQDEVKIQQQNLQPQEDKNTDKNQYNKQKNTRNNQEEEEMQVIEQFTYQYSLKRTLRIFGYYSLVSLIHMFLMLFAMTMNMFYILSVCFGYGFGKMLQNIALFQNRLRKAAIMDNTFENRKQLNQEIIPHIKGKLSQAQQMVEKQASIQRKMQKKSQQFVNPFESSKKVQDQ